MMTSSMEVPKMKYILSCLLLLAAMPAFAERIFIAPTIAQ